MVFGVVLYTIAFVSFFWILVQITLSFTARVMELLAQALVVVFGINSGECG